MIVRLATHAMGTRFEIVLSGDGPERLRCVGDSALEEIREAHARLSLFDAGSFVSHINAQAAEKPVRLDEEMWELLAECAAVHRASGGAFDITVAPVMRAWGFHGNGGPARRDVDGRNDMAYGMSEVELDAEAHTIRFRRHGMAIDLGGIGKGHALDAAAAVLREHEVECALLHGGTSTVVAIGAPEGEEGWRVALARPAPPTSSDVERSEPAPGGRMGAARPSVLLRDAALSVSAPHGRTVEVEGTARGHVIDPSTGAPASGVRLAAVVAGRARAADAWSTALLVRGEQAARMNGDMAALIGVEDDGAVRWIRLGVGGEFFSLPDQCERPPEDAAR